MTVSNHKSIQDQIDQASADPNKKVNKFYRIAKPDSKVNFLLQVTPANVKSWCFRYTIKTKTRMMGLVLIPNEIWAKKIGIPVGN
jgi:hypothetical protein